MEVNWEPETEPSFDLYWRHFDITTEDKLFWILPCFHVFHFLLLFLCWNHEISQIFNFLFLGGFLLAAEKLNEFMASQTWLSKTNYFDSSGMFFTFAISFPIITHLLILVILWVKRTADQLVKVKRQEIKLKLKKSREGEILKESKKSREGEILEEPKKDK